MRRPSSAQLKSKSKSKQSKGHLQAENRKNEIDLSKDSDNQSSEECKDTMTEKILPMTAIRSKQRAATEKALLQP